jgi:hypothetical protein
MPDQAGPQDTAYSPSLWIESKYGTGNGGNVAEVAENASERSNPSVSGYAIIIRDRYHITLCDPKHSVPRCNESIARLPYIFDGNATISSNNHHVLCTRVGALVNHNHLARANVSAKKSG